MAVYKRHYKPFDGELTPQRWRFAILIRYSLQTVFKSRLLNLFFTLCLLPHLCALVLIYLHHNLGALRALDLQAVEFLNIDGNFFLDVFVAETYLSFLMVTFVGPGLIAPDLANNALPLYLSRPFSRREYIAGKLGILLIMTSLITWIPGLLLVGIQANEAGLPWLAANARIPIGIFVGSWIWIVTVSLVALALSAWVKMRPAAIFSLLGVFFVVGSFGNLANALLALQPPWGLLMNMNATMRGLWNWLLLGDSEYGAVFRRGTLSSAGLPSWTALVALAGFSALSLALLVRKVRACEVVR